MKITQFIWGLVLALLLSGGVLASNFGDTDKISAKDEALYLQTVESVNKSFTKLDAYMKEDKFAEQYWFTKLNNQFKAIHRNIKMIERRWPKKDIKPLWAERDARAVTAKAKRKEALAQVASVANSDKGNKIAPEATATVKPKAKNVEAKVAAVESTLLTKIKTEQENYIKNGKIEVWDNSTGNIAKSPGESAYLSFSNDYNNTKDKKISFTGKDFIYAHLHLPKKLNAMLPDAEAKGLQYYRVTLKASVNSHSKYANERSQENSTKIKRMADFSLGHDTKLLPLAVVPEKAFFEDLINKYRTNGKFKDGATEEKALSDLLARNFSRQISYLFKSLTPGEYQVVIDFKVTAKLSQEKFFELQNMKGTFLLTVDKEAKERYTNTFDMLTKLYRAYESKHNIAQMRINLADEQKMIDKMSPREKERYNIAKQSPTGYMAAYGGKRADVTFNFGSSRTKRADIDIVWPKGSCEKCEAGTSDIMVTKNGSKTLHVPVGAKVSMNGRTLINSVSENKSLTLYWFY